MQKKLDITFIIYLFFYQIDTEICECLIIFRACEGMEKYTVFSTTIGASYLEEILAIAMKVKNPFTH